MRRILILFLIVISLNSEASDSTYSLTNCPPDSSLVKQILSLPLSNYIGTTVDSLLCALPVGYSSRNFMPIKIGYLRGVTQMYSAGAENSCFVEIYIDAFQHLTVPNRTKTATWDMNMAKQETIAFIKVYKNNFTCVYGCNNAKYYFP